MTATRARLAGVLAIAVLVLVGCGGGRAADAAKVKRTVQRALTALADGNGPAFCALATTGAQAELARTTPGASCAGVVRRISHELSDRVKLGLRHARVGKVSLSGDHATIRAGDITSTRGAVKGFLQASAAPHAAGPPVGWQLEDRGLTGGLGYVRARLGDATWATTV